MNFTENESVDHPLSWQLVTENTGYISFDQVRRFFHLEPEDIEFPPDIIVFNQALWKKAHFHQGAHHHHRALITESYIHLYPILQSWQLAGVLYGLSPDAIIRIPSYPFPILMEMDTGKETARQWRSKLTAYRLEAWANPRFALWVIAMGGNLRLSRVHNWIVQQKLPVAWHLSRAAQIQPDAAFWESQVENARPASLSPQEDGLPQLWYRELGQQENLSMDEANRRLKEGWAIAAREIISGGLLYYLKAH
ncbi:MAG: hypothetical protein M1493_16030 [Firmicutes bacterium]|jgi:hypothetical protein|nr:hypothetical protein [Bacillota bacterium]